MNLHVLGHLAQVFGWQVLLQNHPEVRHGKLLRLGESPAIRNVMPSILDIRPGGRYGTNNLPITNGTQERVSYIIMEKTFGFSFVANSN